MKRKRSYVHIERPPACETFPLPSREDILSLRLWGKVQLIFTQRGRIGERMWVNIVDREYPDIWVGVLRTRPMNLDIRYGQRVYFHPYDVINIAPRQVEDEVEPSH